jgi:hypothetical protein
MARFVRKTAVIGHRVATVYYLCSGYAFAVTMHFFHLDTGLRRCDESLKAGGSEASHRDEKDKPS